MPVDRHHFECTIEDDAFCDIAQPHRLGRTDGDHRKADLGAAKDVVIPHLADTAAGRPNERRLQSRERFALVFEGCRRGKVQVRRHNADEPAIHVAFPTGAPLRAAAGILGRSLLGARHFLELEGLDDVAFLDVVVAVEHDTALEALLDLAHVVVEAPQ